MQVAYVLQENVDKIAANASGMMRYLSPGLISMKAMAFNGMTPSHGTTMNQPFLDHLDPKEGSHH